MTGFQKGMHIHRKDNSKDYCPENCMWITASEHGKLHAEDRREKKRLKAA
jgi:hypothetical protein